MKFSENQLGQIKNWVEQGAGISEVQKRIESDFGLSMTYMDVRFLLDDIDAELKDAPKKAVSELDVNLKSDEISDGKNLENNADVFAEAAEEFNNQDSEFNPATQNLAASQTSPMSDEQSEDAAANEESQLDGVKVSLDKTPRQGTFASGSVTFSDGAVVDWMVDMNGQLGLLPSVVGYSPPQEDIEPFQKQLQKLLGVEQDANSNVDDSKIEVSVSPIQRPDSLAFGDVIFSDGTKAEWRIDRTGQLVLIPAEADKRPPQDEMPAFQKKLSAILSKGL